MQMVIVIVSYWKPGLCRYHLYSILFHNMVKESLPIDYGLVQLRYLVLMNGIFFIIHSFDYYKSIISLILYNLWTMVIVQIVIYQKDEPVKLLSAFFVSSLVMMYYCVAVHVLLSWIGYQYVAAELPRESNERLLNNLQEGLFIVSEENKEVLFQNSAASRIKTNLESECIMNLTSEKNVFDLEQNNYRQIDMAEFKKAESVDDCIKILNEDKINVNTNMEQIIQK